MTPHDLRAHIAALGLTQAQAAQLIGVKPRTLRHWLLGDRKIPRTAEIVVLLAITTGYGFAPNAE